VSTDNFQVYYVSNHPPGVTQRFDIYGYVTLL